MENILQELCKDAEDDGDNENGMDPKLGLGEGIDTVAEKLKDMLQGLSDDHADDDGGKRTLPAQKLNLVTAWMLSLRNWRTCCKDWLMIMRTIMTTARTTSTVALNSKKLVHVLGDRHSKSDLWKSLGTVETRNAGDRLAVQVPLELSLITIPEDETKEEVERANQMVNPLDADWGGFDQDVRWWCSYNIRERQCPGERRGCMLTQHVPKCVFWLRDNASGRDRFDAHMLVSFTLSPSFFFSLLIYFSDAPFPEKTT